MLSNELWKLSETTAINRASRPTGRATKCDPLAGIVDTDARNSKGEKVIQSPSLHTPYKPSIAESRFKKITFQSQLARSISNKAIPRDRYS